MFDISFSEIMVIAVVAVVVVGPQRLPKTVRTIAHVMGRAQRYVSDIKSDIQREMELEDFKKATQTISNIGKDLENTVRSTVNDAQKSVQSLGKDLQSMESELKNIATEKTTAQENRESNTETKMASETSTAEKDEVMPTAIKENTLVVENKTNDGSGHNPDTFAANPADYQVPSFLKGDITLSIPEPAEQKSDDEKPRTTP